MVTISAFMQFYFQHSDIELYMFLDGSAVRLVKSWIYLKGIAISPCQDMMDICWTSAKVNYTQCSNTCIYLEYWWIAISYTCACVAFHHNMLSPASSHTCSSHTYSHILFALCTFAFHRPKSILTCYRLFSIKISVHLIMWNWLSKYTYMYSLLLSDDLCVIHEYRKKSENHWFSFRVKPCYISMKCIIGL